MKEALAVDAKEPVARWISAQLAFRRGDLEEAKGALEEVIEEAGPDSRFLHSLGLVLDRLDRSNDAFAALTASHQQESRTPAAIAMDRTSYPAMIEALSHLVNQGLGSDWPAEPPDDGLPTPVFLVGFVRSGTTLAEQALASHPAFMATGERISLDSLVTDIPGYPQSLATMNDGDVRRLRGKFWDMCQQIFGPEVLQKRLIDKQPMDMVHLALVKRLFPDAKVIMTLRDPRDVCLSCYLQRFTPNVLTVHFHSMGETVALYGEAMALWDVYRDKLGLDCVTFRYEDMVADFDREIGRLLDFLGEEWDDSVPEYAKTAQRNRVNTASYRDVTSKVFDRSVGRWEKYRDPLGDILPLLEPIAERLGY